MDCAVVHDNDRLGGGERLHFENEIRNERRKKIAIERAFDDHTLNDAIIERDRREDRVPINMSNTRREMKLNSVTFCLERSIASYKHEAPPKPKRDFAGTFAYRRRSRRRIRAAPAYSSRRFEFGTLRAAARCALQRAS